MSLPCINAPSYTLTIPSSGKKVKYRPFLVKEEKSLLIAQQSEELNTMIDTLKLVINSCLFGQDVNVDDLAIFDLEYIFTQIRSKSVGEEVSLIFRCGHCNDPEAKREISIDISKLEVEIDKNHKNNISLGGDLGVIMRYPSIDTMKILEDDSLSDVEQIFRVICECIDVVYEGDNVFHTKEHSLVEVEEFVNNLTQHQFESIKQFFETMPKFRKTVEFDCPVCGKHNKTALEGIQSFF